MGLIKMAELSLYLIRHAQACQRGPAYPDDTKRPLVPKGHRQAKALAKALALLEIRFDRLFSSPYRRARQTAEAVESMSKELQILDALARDGYPELLQALTGALNASERHVALVGHEPYLGELASLLLTGAPQSMRVRFKKAGLVVLHGPLEAGKMSLEGYLTPTVYKHLGV